MTRVLSAGDLRTFSVDPRLERLVPGFDAPFFQAGLAGYSDGAMRLTARSQGCPFCVTEALLDITLLAGGRGRYREDPDRLQSLGATTALDHPIAGQLLGGDPDTMARAADLLVAMGYDTIDLNFACPVRKVRQRYRGGHLLAKPHRALEIVDAVAAAVAGRVPLTLKLRRACNDTQESARAFDVLLDGALTRSVDWVTVHARTVVQKYEGPSDWRALAEIVRRRPGALIFGSGDIWQASDIFAMIEQTGVAAVSVARGCIGNPWIFRQARELMAGLPPRSPTLLEQRDTLLAHLALAMSLHGEPHAARLMRKFGIRFSQHHPAAEQTKQAFIACTSLEAWHAVIAQSYPR